MALVFEVILSSTSLQSICQVWGNESTKTGMAPTYAIEFTDAI